MTVSRLFTNPPCSAKGNREFNGALVEQTRFFELVGGSANTGCARIRRTRRTDFRLDIPAVRSVTAW
jgi:hypothetical protein